MKHLYYPWIAFITGATAVLALTATSMPPEWAAQATSAGPQLSLGREHAMAVTRVSVVASAPQELLGGNVTVQAVLAHEIDSGSAPVRVTLVPLQDKSADEASVASQTHALSGTGDLWLELHGWRALTCSGQTCRGDILVELHSARPIAGSVTLDWLITAEVRGEGAAPPSELTISINSDLPGDMRPRPEVPAMVPAWYPNSLQGDRGVSGPSLIVDAQRAGDALHLTVQPKLDRLYDSVKLYMRVHHYDMAERPPVPARFAVIADGSQTPLIVHDFTTRGTGDFFLEGDLTDALRCGDEDRSLCTRAFTFTLDIEGIIARSLWLEWSIAPVIAGQEGPAVDLIGVELTE